MSRKSTVTIPVFPVSQPIGDYYVGSVAARKLLEITYTEIRKFQDGTQETIAGIQRERSKAREKDLARYVNLGYATFPTSIVIAIDDRMAKIFPQENCYPLMMLEISEYGSPEDPEYIPLSRAAFIIDGQHRLAGLEHLDEHREFDVGLSIFVGADGADKAEIFGRVNQSQSKVNRSLVYDLFSLAKHKSPYKMAHEVVLALNADKSGPFFDKVKRLGKSDPGKGHIQTLSQATVVDPIVNLISSDPEEERNISFLGRRPPRRREHEWERHIFQPFYDQDDDIAIFKIMTNFFSAVESKWTDAWLNAEPGMILNRTTGYLALMRFMHQCYLKSASAGEVPTKSDFSKILKDINIPKSSLNSEKYIPGSTGVGRLFRDLMEEAAL